MGSLVGFPQSPLTRASYVTGDSLAYWIERQVPSFIGNVPVKYAEALLKLFRDVGVPAATSQDAFSKLNARGVKFDFPSGYRPMGGPPVPVRTSRNPDFPYDRYDHPAKAQEITDGEARRQQLHTLEELERQYVLAIRTNNAPGAEHAIAAAFQLIWGLISGYGKTRQAKANIKMVEWEEFNTAVEEAMGRARMLQGNFRQLSREEFNSLRGAPNPGAFQNVVYRFATRTTLRTIPPSRRARR